jgi:glutamate-1-semialdehyde 2,1-aminomutase
VTPDLTTFGKIIGAGMPVGAYGGRREIMEMVSPVGAVYQAGTLSGNPVAMAAGIAQLSYLKEHPEAYAVLNQKSDRFFEELQKIVDESGRGYHVNHITSLGSLFFTDREVVDYESAQTSDTKAYADYCNYMQNHGIYLAPAQFEAVFISMEHTEEQLARTLELARTYFTKNK